MKRSILFLLAAAALAARAAPSPPGHSHVIDGDPTPVAAPPPAVEFRANQINRCTDAAGRIKLQDTPCDPVVARAVAGNSAASASDVVELSALPPRTNEADAVARPPAVERRSLSDIALSLGWKLALFAAAAYAVFRLIRSWRDTYAFKAALEDTPRHSRR